jgi:hypothetical protein
MVLVLVMVLPQAPPGANTINQTATVPQWQWQCQTFNFTFCILTPFIAFYFVSCFFKIILQILILRFNLVFLFNNFKLGFKF